MKFKLFLENELELEDFDKFSKSLQVKQLIKELSKFKDKEKAINRVSEFFEDRLPEDLREEFHREFTRKAMKLEDEIKEGILLEGKTFKFFSNVFLKIIKITVGVVVLGAIFIAAILGLAFKLSGYYLQRV